MSSPSTRSRAQSLLQAIRALAAAAGLAALAASGLAYYLWPGALAWLAVAAAVAALVAALGLLNVEARLRLVLAILPDAASLKELLRSAREALARRQSRDDARI